MRRPGSLAVLSLMFACRSGPPGDLPHASNCGPPSGQLAPTATAEGLAGEYRIRLVATSGPRGGAAAVGSVRLRPVEDSLRSPPPVLGIHDSLTILPLRGTAQFDARSLGATVPGDLGADDPMAPGVLVLERHSGRAREPASIVLRVGADANRRDALRFDGGFLALTVRRMDGAGFAGTWASGSGGRQVGGYFCADRIAP